MEGDQNSSTEALSRIEEDKDIDDFVENRDGVLLRALTVTVLVLSEVELGDFVVSILSGTSDTSNPFMNGSEGTTLPETSERGRRNEVSKDTSTTSGKARDGKEGDARRGDES